MSIMPLEDFESGTPGDLITTENTRLNVVDPLGAVFADTPLGRGRDGTIYAASPAGGDVPFQIGYVYPEVQASGEMLCESLIDIDTGFSQSRTLCGMWYFNGVVNLPAVQIEALGFGQDWAGWISAAIGDTPTILLNPYSFDEWYRFHITWDETGDVAITMTNVDGAELAAVSGSVTAEMLGKFIGHFGWINAPVNPINGGCHTPINYITAPGVAPETVVELYPREDGYGISGGLQIFPEPKSERIYGGRI